MAELRTQIADNLASVRQQIADAASRCGRDASAITLVAVTKYVDVDAAQVLLEAGCHDLGESRPQQLWRKAAALADADVRWHLIGHLQRNKVRRTLPCLTRLHACDSLRLLGEINRAAAEMAIELKALLEVNISGETAKHGFHADEMPSVIEALPDYEHVRIDGLMAMASLEGDLDDARRDFERLRLLRDRLAATAGANVTLDQLSMGMSRDFQVAIEEGATIVRVGSALFEGLDR